LHFAFFSEHPINDLTFAPRAGAAPQKLQFYPTARSPRYEYRGAMPLTFLDSTSGSSAAEIVIPSGIRDALLLVTLVEGGGDGAPTKLRYQVSVLDDGAARHGPGGLA